jgi:hypothetical protein
MKTNKRVNNPLQRRGLSLAPLLWRGVGVTHKSRETNPHTNTNQNLYVEPVALLLFYKALSVIH